MIAKLEAVIFNVRQAELSNGGPKQIKKTMHDEKGRIYEANTIRSPIMAKQYSS